MFGVALFLYGFDLVDKRGLIEVYPGISIADIFALLSVIRVLIQGHLARLPPKLEKYYLSCMLFGLLLIFVTFVKFSSINDVLNAVRYNFYLIVIYLSLSMARKKGFIFFLPFIFGFCCSFYINVALEIMMPTNIKVAGFPQVIERNFSGGLLSGFLILTIFIFEEQQRPYFRFLLALLIALILAATLFVFSFGAWLSVLLTVPLLIKVFLFSKQSRLYPISFLLAGILAIQLGFFQGLYDLVVLKFMTRGDVGLVESNWARISNYISSLYIFFNHPFLGIPFSEWGYYNDTYAGNKDFYFENDNPHSSLFLLISSVGIFGMSAYLLTQILFFKALVKSGPILIIAGIGVMIQQLFLVQYYTSIAFSLFLAVILLYVDKKFN